MKNLTHIFNFGYVIILKEDKNEHLFLKIKNCSSKILIVYILILGNIR